MVFPICIYGIRTHVISQLCSYFFEIAIYLLFAYMRTRDSGGIPKWILLCNLALFSTCSFVVNFKWKSKSFACELQSWLSTTRSFVPKMKTAHSSRSFDSENPLKVRRHRKHRYSRPLLRPPIKMRLHQNRRQIITLRGANIQTVLSEIGSVAPGSIFPISIFSSDSNGSAAVLNIS